MAKKKKKGLLADDKARVGYQEGEEVKEKDTEETILVDLEFTSQQITELMKMADEEREEIIKARKEEIKEEILANEKRAAEIALEEGTKLHDEDLRNQKQGGGLLSDDKDRMVYAKGEEVKVDDKILIADSDNSQIFKSMEDWKKGTNPNWNTLSQDSEGNIYVDYSVKETPPSISLKDKLLDSLVDVGKFLKRDLKKEQVEMIRELRRSFEQDKIDEAKRKEYEKKFPQIEKERLARGDFYEGEEGYKSPFAEGGDVDAQMEELLPTEDEDMKGVAISISPVTATKEDIEQLETADTDETVSDEQMEDDHLDFIIDQSLDQEEEMYLMETLQADSRLSMIFDKVMDTASEFSGSGPVEGLGSEVSDSIPARLSDGEFVMTAKATDEIGADNLQRMMEDAETASDNRQQVAEGGKIEDKPKVDRFGKAVDKDIAEDEIKKGMLSVNPRLQ